MKVEMRRRERGLLARIKDQERELNTVKAEKREVEIELSRQNSMREENRERKREGSVKGERRANRKVERKTSRQNSRRETKRERKRELEDDEEREESEGGMGEREMVGSMSEERQVYKMTDCDVEGRRLQEGAQRQHR